MPHTLFVIPVIIPDPAGIKLKLSLAQGASDDHREKSFAIFPRSFI